MNRARRWTQAGQDGPGPLHFGLSMLPQPIGGGRCAWAMGRLGAGWAASRWASALTFPGVKPLCDLRHAVGRFGSKRPVAPGAEPRIQAVHRQAQQPGHIGAHAAQSHAVAAGASRQRCAIESSKPAAAAVAARHGRTASTSRPGFGPTCLGAGSSPWCRRRTAPACVRAARNRVPGQWCAAAVRSAGRRTPRRGRRSGTPDGRDAGLR